MSTIDKMIGYAEAARDLINKLHIHFDVRGKDEIGEKLLSIQNQMDDVIASMFPQPPSDILPPQPWKFRIIGNKLILHFEEQVWEFIYHPEKTFAPEFQTEAGVNFTARIIDEDLIVYRIDDKGQMKMEGYEVIPNEKFLEDE